MVGRGMSMAGRASVSACQPIRMDSMLFAKVENPQVGVSVLLVGIMRIASSLLTANASSPNRHYAHQSMDISEGPVYTTNGLIDVPSSNLLHGRKLAVTCPAMGVLRRLLTSLE
jgi:hypothetical protein